MQYISISCNHLRVLLVGHTLVRRSVNVQSLPHIPVDRTKLFAMPDPLSESDQWEIAEPGGSGHWSESPFPDGDPTGFYTDISDTDATIPDPPVRQDTLPRLTQADSNTLARLYQSIAFEPGSNVPTVMNNRSSRPDTRLRTPSYASRLGQASSQLPSVKLHVPMTALPAASVLAPPRSDMASLLSIAAVGIETMPDQEYQASLRFVASRLGLPSGGSIPDLIRPCHPALVSNLAQELSGYDCNDPNIQEIRRRMEQGSVVARTEWDVKSSSNPGYVARVCLWGMGQESEDAYRGEVHWLGAPRALNAPDGSAPQTKNYFLPPRRDLTKPYQGSFRPR